MLGLNYGPDHDPLAILQHRDRGAISVYAKGEDYHEVIKPRLKEIQRRLLRHVLNSIPTHPSGDRRGGSST